MKKIYTLFSLFVFIASSIYSQDTLLVPSDFTTIQAAINAANSGDVVLVSEDTYYENINFSGKAISVASYFIIDGDTNHINNTIINGSQPNYPDSGSVVYLINGEDTTSVLCGFTITGGSGSLITGSGFAIRIGGGILCGYSGGKIMKNKIIQNEITDYSNNALGGGVCALLNASDVLMLEDNVIQDNIINGNVVAGGGILIAADGKCFIRKNYILNNAINGVGLASGGGIHCEPMNTLGVKISIVGNKIESNSVSTSMELYGVGGGVSFNYIKGELRNNLVVKNTARFGGGLSILNFYDKSSNSILYLQNSFNISNFATTLPDDFTAINNTIADNEALVSGGGIQTLGVMVKCINSIVWGNYAPDNSQILGSLQVEFSDVEGGYSGTGNIDLDPIFSDPDNYYLTDIYSPCIDAGNPDPMFNDIEDPLNPGNPLWPALGTLINDMGAYGGNSEVSIQNLFIHGPHFQSFLNRILSAPYPDKQAIADSFVTFIETFYSFPFIEENSIAYYIYTGNVNSVNVPGDANGWDGSLFPMTKIGGTNFWYRAQVFETDARLDYKFLTNGTNWILDPRNPKQCTGGFGPNSELAMPDYIYPPEIEYNPGIPHGVIHDTLFHSVNLSNSRTIRVYTPPSYDPSSTMRYPLILLHDGAEWISLGYAQNILDNLINENLIDPIVAVFVPPVNRNEEYAFSQRQLFENFIIDELMPYIRTKYKVRLDAAGNAMTGFSFGGLITTQICYNNPEIFGLCGPMSPAYWPNSKEVLFDVLDGPKKDLIFYVDWGSYELDLAADGRVLVQSLISKGYENVAWNEWHEGHSWGNWYAHLDNLLEHFDILVNVKREDEIVDQFSLSQNYPNPFNPSTKIKYRIPESTEVSIEIYNVLGEKITELINEEMKAGDYEIEFKASGFPSGVYFYQLKAGDFVSTKKMLLLK